MVAETVLSVTEQTKLAQRQHRSFTFDKTTHTFRLDNSINERVHVVRISCSCRKRTRPCFNSVLSYKNNRLGISHADFIEQTDMFLLTFSRLGLFGRLHKWDVLLLLLFGIFLPFLLRPLHLL